MTDADDAGGDLRTVLGDAPHGLGIASTMNRVVLKVIALLLNLTAAIYLLPAKRLLGLRGGQRRTAVGLTVIRMR